MGKKRKNDSTTSRRRPRTVDAGLPSIYQQALVETVADLDIVTELLNRNLEQEDVGRILRKLSRHDRDLFTSKLAELLRRTAALLLLSRRLSESLSLEVLLPRMVELISDFLDAERCTIFLHDAGTDELYTKAAVGLESELRFPSDQGIAGTVFRSGQSLIIVDAYADPRFNPSVDQSTGFRTRNVLCVPLRHRRDDEARIVGVAQVLNKRHGGFSEEDLKLLDTLNSQAASAFVNAILHEEIRKARAQELELLEVTTALSTELQLRPLLVKIMDTVASLVEADRATLFLHDRKTEELWALVGRGERLEEIRFPSQLGIAGHVFTTGESISIPDAYADGRFNREMDFRTGYRTRNILCVPVVNRAGQIIGVAQVLNKKSGPFTTIDEKRLRAFSAQASVAMENARLFDEVNQIKNYNESILESITNGVVTVGASRLIEKANIAALRLLGKLGAADVVVGQAVETFFRGPNEWITQTLEEVLRSGQPTVEMDADLVLEDAGRAAPGSRMSVNLAVLPLADPKEASGGCILMIEDITREKRLKGAFSRYMSKEVADRLLEQGEAALGGRMQTATVLFCDIRSFTPLSERIGPQETVKLLNEYFSLMADIILEKGGLLDKYIGDAIMAVFGVPLTGPRDADLAVESAIAMFRALRGFNARRLASGQDPISMSMGINTDEVVSGNIGSLKRMDYTVIGDGVNLASRLEGANRVYGTQLLVSELTVRDLRGTYTLREVDRMRVRGKSRPVGVFEVLDELEEGSARRSPRFLGLHEKGLVLYRQRDWARAREVFESALDQDPADPISQLYRRRCGHFLENPPAADWDGVWDLREK